MLKETLAFPCKSDNNPEEKTTLNEISPHYYQKTASYKRAIKLLGKFKIEASMEDIWRIKSNPHQLQGFIH